MAAKKKKLNLFAIILLITILIVVWRTWGQKLIHPRLFTEQVQLYSQNHELDENLIYAVIRVESKFQADAISEAGAVGLMQIMPKTGRWASNKMKIKDYTTEKLMQPDMNIAIGCWYISYLMDYFDGDLNATLAAYNGGMGNVRKWINDQEDGRLDVEDIPYKETRDFVDRVEKSYDAYKKLYVN